MDLLGLLTLIVAVAFVGLLAIGRRDIVRGANADVANGAVLLVLAAVAGTLVLQMLAHYV